MAWLKAGDNAATYPAVMRLDADPSAEDWTLNEAFGFLTRCALQSAGHMTDYRIDYGTAKLLGNGRHDLLMSQLERAGLITGKGRGRARVWTILADPEFLHIRLRDEIEFERQRKRDASNVDLTIPVRLRDGDSCRYCGVIVSWTDRKGDRAATYDHREPGQPATLETYVVACKKCNSSRKDDPAADERMPLLAPPVSPFYSSGTRAHLAKHGAPVPDLTDNRPIETGPAGTDIEGPDRDGSGRVGSGRDGQGRDGTEQDPDLGRNGAGS